MKKIILLVLIALLSVVNASAQIPVTSTAGNDVWYYIRGQARNPSVPDAAWLTQSANGTDLTFSNFVGGDDQLWKVVENGTGLALQNKASGNFLNSDVPLRTNGVYTVLNTQSILPSLSLQMKLTSKGPVNSVVIADKNATINASNLYASITFLLMVSGSNQSYVPINYHSENDANSSFLFLSMKDALGSQIKVVTDFKNASSIGPNPGQFTEDVYNGAQSAIDYAQDIFDNVNSTSTDYLAAKNELTAIYTLLRGSIIVPQLSDENNDYWYFFQGTRPTGNYMTSLGAGLGIKNLPLVSTDDQLWKFVSNGTGFALVNKLTGEYLNSDIGNGLTSANLTTVAAVAPSRALRFLISPEISNKSTRFYIENTELPVTFRLKSGTSVVTNDSYVVTDNATWLIMDYAVTQRQALIDEIIADSVSVPTFIVGSVPGQFNVSDVDNFKAAIAAARTVYNDPDQTSDVYIAARQTLIAAKQTLKSKAITPKISTDAETKWYCLKGSRPAATPFMASYATDTLNHVKYQDLSINDKELWRFVANGTGFALQNKATMEYLNADLPDHSNMSTKVVMPTRPLKFIVSPDVTNNVCRFWIENDSTDLSAVATFRLHANPSAVMNYLGSATDNCTWLILEQSEAAKIAFLADTTTAHFVYKISHEGTTYGKFAPESRSAFQSVIATSDSKNTETLSADEMNAAYLALHTAIPVFKSTKVTDVSTITSTTDAPKWFYIVGNNPNGTDAFNKRISKNDMLVSAAIPSESTDQIWRFEINPTDALSVMLINKTTNEELSVINQSEQATMIQSGFGGTFLKLSTYSDGISTRMTYDNVTTTTITELIHCDASLKVMGLNNATNNNSAWRFDAVSDGTAVKNVSTDKFIIRSHNGVITVDGVDNFEVYSVLGQKMNNKLPQNKGVCLVKVGNQTQKYIVK